METDKDMTDKEKLKAIPKLKVTERGIKISPGQVIELDELEIHPFYDPTAELIDELAHMCKYWEKQRESGQTTKGIRYRIMLVITDINTEAGK